MLGVQEDGKIDRRKRYSPAAALAVARKENFRTSVYVSTLYSYISKRVFLHLTNKDLWEKGRTAHPTLPSITNRPEHINPRSERGHREMDLVVGRSESRNVLLMMLERQAREPLVFKLPNKQAASM